MKEAPPKPRRVGAGSALKLLLCLACAGAAAAPSRADEPGPRWTTPRHEAARFGPQVPVSYTPTDGALLARAAASELDGDAETAATIYRSLAARYPDDSAAQWRAARALYLMGTQAASDHRAARAKLFGEAKEIAESALARDPDCAGCALYLAGAYGGLVPIRGVLFSARHVAMIKANLDHAIAQNPTEQDSPNNSLLGNLYLARASLLRLVPEWRWLTWVIGMRGDLDAALDDILRARKLHPNRIDFQVEHAVLHLCRAERRKQPAEREIAHELLRGALVARHTMPTDPLDQALARRLLEDDSRACEVTRSGTLDIEKNNR